MQAIDWLLEYGFVQRGLVAGVAVGTVCSLLSVTVVVKRMAAIGQGISHAGYGGVGVALFFGLTGPAQDAVILLFCLICAALIGALSRGRRVEPDSAIGILLVAGLALGLLLDQLRISLMTEPWYAQRFATQGARTGPEMLLYGSLLDVSTAQMWIAIAMGALILIVAAALFKELVFFTFDEKSSAAFGVPTGVMHYLLLAMIAVTLVLTFQLVGVVLASALLVLPGATALQIGRRLGSVLAWSWIIGMIGVVGGLTISLEVGNIAVGPCIVGVLCLIFLAVYTARTVRGRAPIPRQ